MKREKVKMFSSLSEMVSDLESQLWATKQLADKLKKYKGFNDLDPEVKSTLRELFSATSRKYKYK